MVSDSHRFLFSSRRRKAVSSEGAIRIRSVPRSRQSLAFTREKKIIRSTENVAHKLFGFGSGTKKFSRRNEKILAPLFGKTRAAIGAFPA